MSFRPSDVGFRRPHATASGGVGTPDTLRALAKDVLDWRHRADGGRAGAVMQGIARSCETAFATSVHLRPCCPAQRHRSRRSPAAKNRKVAGLRSNRITLDRDQRRVASSSERLRERPDLRTPARKDRRRPSCTGSGDRPTAPAALAPVPRSAPASPHPPPVPVARGGPPPRTAPHAGGSPPATSRPPPAGPCPHCG